MKIKFLGTSAGEQYPGIWCNCPTCHSARVNGGKDIRQNSCLYIAPDIMIDFPYEIVTQARTHSVDLAHIEHLFITHSHKDHFHPYILQWRQRRKGVPTGLALKNLGPCFSELKKLNIYGNSEVCTIIRNELPGDLSDYAIELHEVKAFKDFKTSDMTVIPILANHKTQNSETPLNYIIEKNNSVIFYGLDSGWFLPESYEAIKRYKYDFVIVEGTFGLATVDRQHFDFEKVKAAKKLFETDGLLKEKASFIVTHFCPHHSPRHSEIESYFATENIIPSYDGMEIQSGAGKCL